MKKVLILSLVLVLLLGVAANGTFGLFSDAETSTGNQFTAWVEEVICPKFNVSDDGSCCPRDSVFQYDADGTFADIFDLVDENGRPSGVATVGDYVYVLDWADKQVYKYTCSGSYVGVSKVLKKEGGSGIGNPDGLAIYDDEMWVVVWGHDFIMYRYSLSDAFSASGTIQATMQVPPHPNNDNPTGLAVDSNYLYVLDDKWDELFYRYDRNTGVQAGVSGVLKDVGGNSLQYPAGAMSDGTSLWVVDSGTNKMYEYDKNDLFAGSGTINAISEFALHGNNGNATGV